MIASASFAMFGTKRIRRIVFWISLTLPLHKRLHIGRWHRPDLVVHGTDLPSPELCSCARLHGNDAGGLGFEKRDHLAPRQPLSEPDRSIRPRPMHVKHTWQNRTRGWRRLPWMPPPMLRRHEHPRTDTLRRRRVGASVPSTPWCSRPECPSPSPKWRSTWRNPSMSSSRSDGGTGAEG